MSKSCKTEWNELWRVLKCMLRVSISQLMKVFHLGGAGSAESSEAIRFVAVLGIRTIEFQKYKQKSSCFDRHLRNATSMIWRTIGRG